MRAAKLLLALLLAAPAAAQDGRALFEARCASCHAVAADAPPMAGPSLRGLFGRAVGGDPAFDYSPALEAARRAGHRWDMARLLRFLDDPEEMYPGLWMGGNGLPAEAERGALAGWLETVR